MKILAIDPSALTATAAILSEDMLIGEISTTTKLTHSQTIMPMIDELLKKNLNLVMVKCDDVEGLVKELNVDIISKEESERLLSFTNNSGPLFILATVGISLFGNKKIGIITIISSS